MVEFGNAKMHQVCILQSLLDPFHGGKGSERVRASGLNNLYFRMANPSLEYIQSVAADLVKLPYQELWGLRSDCYGASDDPQKFFGRFGVVVDRPENVWPGIANLEYLLDAVMDRYDRNSGRLIPGETLDPMAIADTAYESAEFNKGRLELLEATRQLKAEPRLRKRYTGGVALKRQVMDYVGQHPFLFYSKYTSNKDFDPTWENLNRFSDFHTDLHPKRGGSISGDFGIQDAVTSAEAAMRRYKLERKLKKLPSRDLEQFQLSRLQFGAKAANLIALLGLVERINQAGKEFFGMRLAVPEFQTISVDSYRAWREGKLLDDDLLPIFKWASILKTKNLWGHEETEGSDYIVRSSAVFSEDGQKLTGAGIYQSVRVHAGASFQDFKHAVTAVYQSTDSPRALAYRSEHKLGKEEMGLIVQKFITPDRSFMHEQSDEGYVNSSFVGVPSLMEIVTQTSRNFIRRQELDFLLGMNAHRGDRTFANAHHFPPDQFKARSEFLINIAQLTSVVERVWGGPVQIEFVVDGLEGYFVQVRDLPVNLFSETPTVKFPDQQSIHTASSIGMGDLELPVLDSFADNSEKTGAVVIRDNEMFTMGDNYYRLPKNGAVIVADVGGRNGHIQTICAEKGLVCIFTDRFEEDRPTLYFHELVRLNRVRIVSNGFEGRVYKID